MESADVLVIGGGGSGLRAAIAAREAGADVLLVSKTRVGKKCNTFLARGNIAVAGSGDPRDSSEAFYQDTMVGGRNLGDPSLVRKVARESSHERRILEKIGVRFQEQVGSTPGHSFRRSVRTTNRLGSEFLEPLQDYARKIGVRITDELFIHRLLAPHGAFAGAVGIEKTGALVAISAHSGILATGGYGQIYSRTDNAAGITGDGLCLALRAGALLKDVEFVQFYPTAAGRSGTQLVLYEEILLKTGGVLRNNAEEDILAGHQANGEHALTRDFMCLLMAQEEREGRGVDGGAVLDMSDVDPTGLSLPSQRAVRRKKLLVAPTVHFCMGGVVTDDEGRTTVEGLFAAGETAAGVHGANRLGANSLTEVFVMGAAAGRCAAETAQKTGTGGIRLDWQKELDETVFRWIPEPGNVPEKADPRLSLLNALKCTMWKGAGILRTEESLAQALDSIGGIAKSISEIRVSRIQDLIPVFELENMIDVARLICRAAALRKESRGAHQRLDYPDESRYWQTSILIGTKGRQIEVARKGDHG